MVDGNNGWLMERISLTNIHTYDVTYMFENWERKWLDFNNGRSDEKKSLELPVSDAIPGESQLIT